MRRSLSWQHQKGHSKPSDSMHIWCRSTSSTVCKSGWRFHLTILWVRWDTEHFKTSDVEFVKHLPSGCKLPGIWHLFLCLEMSDLRCPRPIYNCDVQDFDWRRCAGWFGAADLQKAFGPAAQGGDVKTAALKAAQVWVTGIPVSTWSPPSLMLHLSQGWSYASDWICFKWPVSVFCWPLSTIICRWQGSFHWDPLAPKNLFV